MSYSTHQHDGLSALLLVGCGVNLLMGIYFPAIAWPVAVAILVAASLLIVPIGIRPFVVICGVTLAHFLAFGPPPPYGRGDLPLDYLMKFVFVPMTVAAASIAIWYWRVPTRN